MQPCWVFRSPEARQWEREYLDRDCAGSEAEPGAGWKFPEGRLQLSAWKSFLFQDQKRLHVGSEQNPVGAPVGEAER